VAGRVTDARCGSLLVDLRPEELETEANQRLILLIVDVRDLADLRIRAMTSLEAAEQRFIAAGDFMWMEEIAKTLRSRLGERATKVPSRRLPNFVIKLTLPFMPRFKALAPLLGHKFLLASEKDTARTGALAAPRDNDCCRLSRKSP
jgi:dihydroflavonol-4-reductase